MNHILQQNIKTQGTGIGLYMTNQIITKHLKGEILVKNVDFVYKNQKFSGASFEDKNSYLKMILYFKKLTKIDSY